MILTKEIEVPVNYRTAKHYQDLGYVIPKRPKICHGQLQNEETIDTTKKTTVKTVF